MLVLAVVSLWLFVGFTTGQVYPHYSITALRGRADRNHVNDSTEWWQTAAFYQIYPRSFKDSNGDGVGDLNGITEKLDYLKEIGIGATWLSPIFTSPMADFGYDIANFTEIDKIFGTMTDFEHLMKKAKDLNIGILLDFVPNHTSDECEWFKKSAARDPYYKDFYIWHPGKIINGTRLPPTNWLSVFRGSAWQWHEGRSEYYFHQFLKKQPDLNYRNAKVREAMKNVLIYWLEKGVMGFRIDAVPHIFEVPADEHGNLPDEPRNDWNNDPEDWGYLKHIYTVDQAETLDLVYEWRHVLDQFTNQSTDHRQRILMAETYSPIDIVMKYYGNGTVNGAQIPFNFLLLNQLNNNSNAYNYADAINTWLTHMPAGRTANWVNGNHDQNRVGSRLGADRIDMMNMLALTLPGCSVTYQGEEIGMLDVWISWQDTVDPSACNSNPSIYERLSRDPERTPFQWSDAKDAGFSEANKTWLPIGEDYQNTNVAKELAIPNSHLNVFKALQKLRQETTMRHGATEVKAATTNVLAIKRSMDHEYTFIIVMNIFDNRETFDLEKVFGNLDSEMEYVLTTNRSTANIGDRIKTNAVALEAKEAVVLRMVKPLPVGLNVTLYTICVFCFISMVGILVCCCKTARRNQYSTI